MKRLALLGSTGSIGQSTLKIVENLKDEFSIVALAVHSNIQLLAEQIVLFRPKIVAVFDKRQGEILKTWTHLPPVKIVVGPEAMEEVAAHPDVDFVVMAIVGMAALKPTLAAIEAEKTIGLASKEVLVSAGEIVMQRAKEKNVQIIPLDSEHSALFQCLQKEKIENVSKLILTASGGPFRDYSISQLQNVTLQQALNHPTWNMGAKITVDSSTLMNKGLEMIEASYLFNFSAERIEIIIHPQSIIHSFVECIDGTLLAQMSKPHMIYPIQYALTYPDRKPTPLPPFTLLEQGTLEFYPPDFKKFPALSLAYQAIHKGDSYPPYLNAVNEKLVEKFLRKEIEWIDILKKIEVLFERHQPQKITTLDHLFAMDDQARIEATQV